MRFDFKTCGVSHDKVYLRDNTKKSYSLSMEDLKCILSQVDLTATLQKKHHKLTLNEVNK